MIIKTVFRLVKKIKKKSNKVLNKSLNKLYIESPYFNSEYYASKNSIGVLSPIDHFIHRGEMQGCAPCLQLENIAKENSHESEKRWFEYFLKYENRLKYLKYDSLTDAQKIYEVGQSGLLDLEWYLENNKDLSGSRVDGLVHFSLYGINELRAPNPYLDPLYIKDKNDIGDSTPFVYYLNNWNKVTVNPSSKFCVESYLSENEDVAKLGVEPLAHYLNYGINEGRPIRKVTGKSKSYQYLSDSACFLPDWYMNVYEDLRGGDVDPILHYLLYGEAEGRKPNPYFDPKWYRNKIGKDSECYLIDYLEEGFKENISPSMEFSSREYIDRNGISLTNGMSPLEHYLIEGKSKGLRVFKVEETSSSLVVDQKKKLVNDVALRSFVDCERVTLKPASEEFCENRLIIHWVIPDFAIGAGGHMTIFRTIRWLELFGHKNKIWLYNKSQHKTARSAYEDIVNGFQLVKAEVGFCDEGLTEAQGDAIFATDWGSVNFVNSVKGFKKRFYFVQDYEPEFYPMGAYKLAAAETYKNNFECICAGPWLSSLMKQKYNLWAEHFWLSVDTNIYNTSNLTRINSGEVFKIAFYSRHFTPRRAVELGLLALEQLSAKGFNVEVHAFGAALEYAHAPFKLVDHGVCSPEQLSMIYKDCDLGMVFSATNYSLIPQEMMACGLPVAEIDVESTRAVFPDNIVTFLSPNPNIMSEQLAELIFNYDYINDQAGNALKWVGEFSWKKSARVVENSVLDRLTAAGFKSKPLKAENIHASVIIPTYNGGEVFKDVIKAVMEQKAPWVYEVIIIDSGSSDGTIEEILKYPEIKLLEISPNEFQHGRTRNYAISKCSGEFVAVLTHDALPANEYWLYNLVSLIEAHPKAAGGFGKHLAYPEADPYTKRDIEKHFSSFDSLPISLSIKTDVKRFESYDVAWRQILHFYSDNNSCLRKKVWEKYPYPEVDFGEDQAWADLIIKAGYEKVYVKDAIVYHSHDYDDEETYKRAVEEASFFKEYFGYCLMDEESIDENAKSLIDEDRLWGNKLGLDVSLIEKRESLIKSKLKGFVDGAL